MKRFGLVGKSLKHSFSPTYFQKKFSDLGLADHIYQAFEIQDISELPVIIHSLTDLVGLNITLPYKSQVIPMLDEATPLVKKSGACNCIKLKEGKLIGYNTDVTGFISTLVPFLQAHHNNALVLGSGGASKAVQHSLRELMIPFKVVSREKTKGDLVYMELDKVIMDAYTIIINTTPLGMFPDVDKSPPIPYQFINSRHLVYDVIYNPLKTELLRRAEEKGAIVVNGYEMLVAQAEESWKIWNQD